MDNITQPRKGKRTMRALIVLTASFLVLFIMTTGVRAMDLGADIMNEKPDGYETAVLGGGCFWCLESEFRAIDGVLYTRSGYTGGPLDNPTYRDITTGKTGHAEAVEITFDSDKLSYSDLLMFFFTKGHDPTQLNRQGVDVGTQYRSAIFPLSEAQEKTARTVIAELTEDKAFKKPIATTIEAFDTFWEAEDYHQQYYEKFEAQNGKPHIRVLMKKGKKALFGK